MMRTQIRAHWARIRVFFTALVALFILGTLAWMLAGGGLFVSKATLRSYFEDSGGTEPGAEVDFNGVAIGKVTSVRLTGSNDPQRTVEIRMSVNRRFLSQIPSDSKSEIAAANVLGDKYIAITRGKSQVPVTDNSELAAKPTTNVYVRIDLTTFTAQLRTIDAVLKDIQEGKGDLGQFVMTDQLYNDLLAGVTRIQRDIKAAAGTKSPIGQLLYGEDLYRQMQSDVKQVDDALAEIQAGRGTTGRFVRDPAAYNDLRTRLADLRKQVVDIGKTDFMQSDNLYRGWNQTVVSLIRSVDDFNANSLLASAQPYESLTGSMRELADSIRDFRTNPKKYLHLKLF
jgi:phospholipid/cholesterol/gamma-HCH transport system substrate-binding protein